jgi:cytidyltransferase-like protein
MRLLTIGTFDCPHMGHAIFLNQCQKLASKVTVGLRSDELVEVYRGHPPVFSWPERAGLIAELGYEIATSDEPGVDLIRRLRPDILAVGSDWAEKDVYARYKIDRLELTTLGVLLVYIPRTEGISTSELKRRLGA